METGKPPSAGNLTKIVLIGAGCVSVGVGVAGVFLPLLPATPFFLLAAACFVRSSERLYNWLLQNRWTGPPIRNYREKKAMPLRAKYWSIGILWVTLSISAILAPHWWIWLILASVAVGVPLLILSIPTLDE